MTFALVAASAILMGPGDPKAPELVYGSRCDRIVQWTMIPGGAIVPMPMPFVVMVPLERSKAAEFKSNRLKQEWHVIVEAESLQTEAFAKALIEQVQGSLESIEKFDAFKKYCFESKTDPIQVIDPVITGF